MRNLSSPCSLPHQSADPDVAEGTFNGMWDLAAQLVTHIKTSPYGDSSEGLWGNNYIVPAKDALLEFERTDTSPTDLVYTVYHHTEMDTRGQKLGGSLRLKIEGTREK